MVKLIPPEQRSKALQRYYDVVKPTQEAKRKAKVKPYNAGAPRIDLASLSPFHQVLGARLWNKRSYCLKEGLPFDLDEEWLRKQVPVCAVTGAALTNGGKPGPLTASLDQIIPSAGYTKANTRIVAYWFNISKREWPDEVIQKIIIDAAAHMSAVKE